MRKFYQLCGIAQPGLLRIALFWLAECYELKPNAMDGKIDGKAVSLAGKTLLSFKRWRRESPHMASDLCTN